MKPAQASMVLVPLLTVAFVGAMFVRGAKRPLLVAAFDVPAVDAPRGAATSSPTALLSVRTVDVESTLPAPALPLDVEIAQSGEVMSFSSVTNDEGATFVPLPPLDSDPLSASRAKVRTRAGQVLFDGPLHRPLRTKAEPLTPSWLPSASQEGELRIDVAPFGAKVVLGRTTRLTGLVTGAKALPSGSLSVSVVHADGLTVVAAPAVAGTDGLFSLSVDVEDPYALLELSASVGPLSGSSTVRLYVSLSGIFPEGGAVVRPGQSARFTARADGVKRTLYATVRDLRGVVARGMLDEGRGYTAPPLPRGVYWATFASLPDAWRYGVDRPFVVAASDDDARTLLAGVGPCPKGASVEACLALFSKGPDVAVAASDMAPELESREEHRREESRAYALVVIVLGALLETLLVVRARGRATDERPASEGERVRIDRSVPTVVGVVLTWVGFGLLAASMWLGR